MKSEYFWNFLYTLVFLGLVLFGGYLLWQQKLFITQLGIFDFIIISLASYRLTRLLVYDKVLNFIRDKIVKSTSEKGWMVSSRYFLTCPWCAGVWMSLFITSLYLYHDLGKFLAYVLAVAGVASFIHITITLLGWVAEERKHHLKMLKKEEKLKRLKSSC